MSKNIKNTLNNESECKNNTPQKDRSCMKFIELNTKVQASQTLADDGVSCSNTADVESPPHTHTHTHEPGLKGEEQKREVRAETLSSES